MSLTHDQVNDPEYQAKVKALPFSEIIDLYAQSVREGGMTAQVFFRMELINRYRDIETNRTYWKHQAASHGHLGG
jgi:hypothetical protein